MATDYNKLKNKNIKNIKYKEILRFANAINEKKKDGQKIMIVASTNAGFFTFMDYSGNIRDILSNSEYLDGRIADDTVKNIKEIFLYNGLGICLIFFFLIFL